MTETYKKGILGGGRVPPRTALELLPQIQFNAIQEEVEEGFTIRSVG